MGIAPSRGASKRRDNKAQHYDFSENEIESMLKTYFSPSNSSISQKALRELIQTSSTTFEDLISCFPLHSQAILKAILVRAMLDMGHEEPDQTTRITASFFLDLATLCVSPTSGQGLSLLVRSASSNCGWEILSKTMVKFLNVYIACHNTFPPSSTSESDNHNHGSRDDCLSSNLPIVSFDDGQSQPEKGPAYPDADKLAPFACLQTSWLQFVEKNRHSQKLLHELVLMWLQVSLPYAEPIFIAALRSLIIGSANLHPDNRISFGDCFLSDQSSCLHQDFCLLMRSVNVNLNEPYPWKLLYTSKKHGSSLNRLVSATYGYKAPMILVIRSVDCQVFGASFFSPLAEAGEKFFGTPETLLWSYLPNFFVYKSTGIKSNFVYLNTKSKFAAKGLGFGGQAGLHRLWLSEDFGTNYTSSTDATFETGSLIQHSDDAFMQAFCIQEVEVWGCGTAESIMAMESAKSLAQNICKEKRTVDRLKLYNNSFTRQVILNIQTNDEKKGNEGGP